MILRLLACVSVFFLVSVAAIVTTAMISGDVTLYSTRYGWVGSIGLIIIAVVLFLVSGLIGVTYFKKYSSGALSYQPYVNVLAVVLVVLVISAVELGEGEGESSKAVTVVVLSDEFSVAGARGKDVVTLVEYKTGRNSIGETQVILSAGSEVEYSRVQEAMQRLRDVGYQNIGLSSKASE